MFRPCIDLHNGLVKQIVGKTLTEQDTELKINFVSDKKSAWFANLYSQDNLQGGHIIMLGQGNEDACLEALEAYPNGMQVGGGINIDNAQKYLDAGASHVIVTSFIFYDGQLDWERLQKIVDKIGKDRLVIDLSCRRLDNSYFVYSNRWQKKTNFEINQKKLENLSNYCSEFLVHAIDVEGLCHGIDDDLVKILATSPIAVTYAGGANSLNDLHRVDEISQGKVDLTIGSALDIFGGQLITYKDAVAFNKILKNKGK